VCITNQPILIVICCIHLYIGHMSRIPFLILSFLYLVVFVVRILSFLKIRWNVRLLRKNVAILLGLQRYTGAPQYCFVTIRISIFEWDIAVSQNNKIFLIKNKKITLTTFWNYCFNQFYDSLPKYKPFLATGLLLSIFVCFQSHIFHNGSMKACVVSISYQLT